MFTKELINENGFDKIVLRDSLSKTFVEIIPACGATLHAFSVFHNGGFLNVIDHYDNATDFAENLTSKGFKSCKLSPFACRVNNATYQFAQSQYKLHKFTLNGSALHGLLYDAAFTVTETYAGADSAKVTMRYAYNGADKGYPFKYECIITYQLTRGHELTITTQIINTDEGLIPLQDGWHPYFTFGKKIDVLQLEFQAKEKLVFNEAMVPTGELVPYEDFGSLKNIGDTSFDDCFQLNFAECQPMCVLRDAEARIQIEIRPSRQYPFLQIYTPPHRNSIAIENLSAPPDTFNNKIKLITLQPGENIIFATIYKITPLI